MAEKTDRRIRKTRAQLRKGLAELMQEKSVSEITVKELVERVDINRSTFYLHYTDIYNMLDSIEKDLFEELETTFQAHAAGTLEEEAFPFIEDVFSILEDNRDIVSALLGPHGDIGFLTKIESILSKYSFMVLKKSFPERDADLACAYSFCLTGCVGVIKAWLSGRLGDKTPDYMAALIYRMIISVLHSAMDAPET
mgnify:FL=1